MFPVWNILESKIRLWRKRWNHSKWHIIGRRGCAVSFSTFRTFGIWGFILSRYGTLWVSWCFILPSWDQHHDTHDSEGRGGGCGRKNISSLDSQFDRGSLTSWHRIKSCNIWQSFSIVSLFHRKNDSMTLVHCDNFGPFRHLNHLLPMRRLEGIRTFMCIAVHLFSKGNCAQVAAGCHKKNTCNPTPVLPACLFQNKWNACNFKSEHPVHSFLTPGTPEKKGHHKVCMFWCSFEC